MPDRTYTPDIPLRVAPNDQPAHRAEPPYQLFLGSALALAVLGGFALGLLLPAARAFEWDWDRWQEFVQAHGQLQLVGFAGLFIAGMAIRLMPRFSGRPLACAPAAPAMVALIAGGVALRAAAPLLDDGALHDAAFAGGAALVLAGGVLFAAMVLRTLLHPASKAEATGWFFVLGAVALVIALLTELLLTVRAIDDGRRLLPIAENNALVSYELYGVVLMFIGGVTTRAVPTLTGRPRPQIAARLAAVALAIGAAAHSGAALAGAIGDTTSATTRLADASLLVISAALLLVVWSSGIVSPHQNRVAAASQRQFWFVRAACAWLGASSLLLAWYAGNAFVDGKPLNQFEVDAVRHALTLGVVTMMIIGMAMLVVPEFAGRRLQHPREGWLIWSMLLALNVAVALRVWPSIEGTGWLSSTRYSPMALAGVLAVGVIAVFAGMFAQSYFEQRRAGWASPEALVRRQ